MKGSEWDELGNDWSQTGSELDEIRIHDSYLDCDQDTVGYTETLDIRRGSTETPLVIFQ